MTTVLCRKHNWIGRNARRNILHDVIDRKLEGVPHLGERRIQFKIDDLKRKNRFWAFKEEATIGKDEEQRTCPQAEHLILILLSIQFAFS